MTIPSIGCTSFAGTAHGLIFPPFMRTETIMVRNPKTGLLEEKKVRYYESDRKHYLPSKEDPRICILGMNWRGAISRSTRDRFIAEAQSKGCKN